jgi:hypothetical protein
MTTVHGRYPLLLLAGVLLATPGLGDTQVSHHLLGETAVPDGLNVAFVGDGFDLEGLATYRKVVSSLKTGLLELDVYDAHRDRFNFYRIDVVDPTGKTASDCSGGSEVPSLTGLEVVGDPGPPVDGIEEMDLEVTQCWGGGNEIVLYTSKEPEAISLAAPVPDVKTVVVVANARLKAGAAQILVTPEQTTVVVVGSHVTPIEGNSAWKIDEHAIAVLAHELGHALGLLDEYEKSNLPFPPPFQECRNVWKPDGPPQWPAPPTWPPTEKTIPWHAILKTCCTPASMSRCRDHKVDGECVLEDLTPRRVYCAYVPRSAFIPQGPCDPPPECDAFPGAWEGAHYSETGHYRARRHCRMSSLNVQRSFCEACREYLDIYLEHFGAGATEGAWPEDRCEIDYGTCESDLPPPAPPPPPGSVERTDRR